MKFDAILMNPPYCRTLHLHLTMKFKDLAAYFCCLQPGTFLLNDFCRSKIYLRTRYIVKPYIIFMKVISRKTWPTLTFDQPLIYYICTPHKNTNCIISYKGINTIHIKDKKTILEDLYGDTYISI